MSPRKKKPDDPGVKGRSGKGPRIYAEGITLRFGQVVALDSFSTRVPEGVVGLLGPNGAGKSTFIKCVLSLVEPEAGSITVDGLDPTRNTTEVRDLVGYMPENDCLVDSMNAVEMVSYMGQVSGMTAKDSTQRSHEVLDFVGIGEERYRPIDSYSTGMKQKVKLAQAVVHDPGILFLDEPTNGLDPPGREEMLALIRKIGESGKTILLSSHVLHEVEKVCEHVIIISDGKLIREGPIGSMMDGDKSTYRLTVRGQKEGVRRFSSDLENIYRIISRKDEGGLHTFVVRGEERSRDLFAAAMKSRVQIRSYGPETLTLEDVFIREFRGGGQDGN